MDDQTTVSDTEDSDEVVDPAVKAFVVGWGKRIKAAKQHPKIKNAFARMRKSMQLAKDGAEKSWVDADKYVVPIINRHINQAVSQLYAKDPKVYAKRKHRRMGTVWDGKLASLNEAAGTLKAQTQQIAMAGQPGAPMPAGPMQPDPMATAILADAAAVKQYLVMMDGLAETLTLLHNHFLTEKASQYKQHFKGLVRRTKVTGVGYVKLSFQRILEKNPDISSRVDTTSEQIKHIEQLMRENAREPFEEESAKLEELRTMLADLQSQETIIVQEGPVLTFPRSTAIIPDPCCTHLKTFTGAGWIAEEWEMTPEQIEENFGVDVKKGYEHYKRDAADAQAFNWSEKNNNEDKTPTACVWRVQNRKTGQVFVICDGYPGYLKEPAAPDVKISRFFDVFPLVFNEIEDEDDIYPPSDAWQARHIQAEFNRSRQGLREHRQQNRPAYVASKGVFDEGDLEKFQAYQSGQIIEVNVPLDDTDISKKLQAKPEIQIKPEMYEVESMYDDLLKVVGTQQANLGNPKGGTATESSIAEQSRTVSLADNVDDLDDMLSLLSDSTCEVMLREMSPETVKQIVGPGAVWPSTPATRDDIIADISVGIQAGSSGRPNAAAELAKMERAMPTILQLPNVNPIPMTQKYLDLLEIDAEDAIVEGLPSITTLNAMLSKPAAGPVGAPNDPNAQGAEGANNTPQPAQNEPQGQPAYPAPAVSA